MTSEQLNNINRIANAAVSCERDSGCPAELSAAQCILESAWLTRAPGNNCFGIKSTDRDPGAHYSITKEFLNGEWQTKRLAFAVYPTLADCFRDHARLIMTGCYAPAWRLYRQDQDLAALTAGVAVHYATDHRNAPKILSIAREHFVVSARG